ncbi:hypothetical protein F5Y01DRAFT_281497 [Xylaria sp. FL0043]|nr:hypothetical protein F5Y01DRAFT_281497 [Xylaria sp. FL0043]
MQRSVGYFLMLKLAAACDSHTCRQNKEFSDRDVLQSADRLRWPPWFGSYRNRYCVLSCPPRRIAYPHCSAAAYSTCTYLPTENVGMERGRLAVALMPCYPGTVGRFALVIAT